VLTLGVNDQKQPYFTKEQRLDFIKRTFFDNDRLKIVDFSNLDDYKKTLSDIGVKYFVRGIRNSVDEYYEKSQIATNKKLYPEIETVFINAEKQYKNCSSSLVKELIEQNKNFKHLVPSGAYDKILEAVLKRK
jgi:pantetheine-phosphate adenylyltransferase